MKPSHEHAILFLAPSATPAGETADKPGPAVDDGFEAMRKLRHPFTALPVPVTASTAPARAA
ncbi:hypothetical protein KRM28CT15_28110 [Krasilnikovia sp. M28-CT-15]